MVGDPLIGHKGAEPLLSNTLMTHAQGRKVGNLSGLTHSCTAMFGRNKNLRPAKSFQNLNKQLVRPELFFTTLIVPKFINYEPDLKQSRRLASKTTRCPFQRCVAWRPEAP